MTWITWLKTESFLKKCICVPYSDKLAVVHGFKGRWNVCYKSLIWIIQRRLGSVPHNLITTSFAMYEDNHSSTVSTRCCFYNNYRVSSIMCVMILLPFLEMWTWALSLWQNGRGCVCGQGSQYKAITADPLSFSSLDSNRKQKDTWAAG